MSRLANKTALITGAAQGIGRATTLAFAKEGARVIAVDLNPAGMTDLAEIDGVETHGLDVTDADAVAAFVQTLEPLDVLFNCAGVVTNGTILEGTEADWEFSFALNVHAVNRLCRLTLPGMLENGGGAIINMSSVASSMKGVPNRHAYGATKAAVIGLTKAIAADYVTKGIRCNAICPGTVDSPSLHDRLRATGDYETAMVDFIARQPMGRVGSAEEIAALALYLASEDAAYTTGQAYAIDGGWTI